MAGGFRFVPRPGMARIVKSSKAVRAELEKKAKAVAKRYAEGVGSDSGDLRRSIRGEVVEGPDGPEGRILAEDWKARLHEYGTSRTRPNGALRRAVDAEGLKLRKGTNR